MTEPAVVRYHNAYHLGKMVGHPDGKWVRYADYAAAYEKGLEDAAALLEDNWTRLRLSSSPGPANIRALKGKP